MSSCQYCVLVNLVILHGTCSWVETELGAFGRSTVACESRCILNSLVVLDMSVSGDVYALLAQHNTPLCQVYFTHCDRFAFFKINNWSLDGTGRSDSVVRRHVVSAATRETRDPICACDTHSVLPH
jgi:hypothetical protein